MHIKGYPPRGGISPGANDNDQEKPTKDAGRTLATTTNTLCTTANRNANTPTPHDPRMDFRRTTLNTKPSDNDNKSTGGGLGLCHAGVKTPSPSLSLSNSPQSVGPLSPLSSGSPSPRSVSMDSMRSDESMTSSSPGTPNEQQPTLTPQQQLHQPAHLLANTPVFPMTLPVRRRPGRPPGSTKKPRNPYDPNDRTRRMSKETGITLRKFFEAGGRDYTEFLKIEQSGANSSQIERQLQVSSTPPTPTFSTAPTYPTASMASPAGSVTIPMVTSSTSSPILRGVPYQTHGSPYIPQQPGLPVYRPTLPTAAAGPSKDKSRPPGLIHMRDLPPDFAIMGRSSPPSYQQSETTTQNSITLPEMEHVRLVAPNRVPLIRPEGYYQHPEQQQVQSDSAALDLSARPRSAESRPPPVMEIKPTPMDDVPPLTCSRPVMLVARASPIEIMPTQMSGHTNKVDFNGNVLSLEPSAPTAQPLPMWTVDQVVNFVASVPECKEYAETFREHRIDGTTLPRLSEEHLVRFINMKLGPAIKLRMALGPHLRTSAAASR